MASETNYLAECKARIEGEGAFLRFRFVFCATALADVYPTKAELTYSLTTLAPTLHVKQLMRVSIAGIPIKFNPQKHSSIALGVFKKGVKRPLYGEAQPRQIGRHSLIGKF